METETLPEPLKRRRGRPRKDDADREVRRAEIVNAAVKLFAHHSYHEVTMSDIAHAVGLNQSSLYYWFKDKEAVLEGILQDSSTSTELAKRVASLTGNHALHLYAVIYADTKMMCEFPCDYFDLEAVALQYPERFTPFFDTYGTLRKALGKIIDAGISAGEFPDIMPTSLATNIVLSLAEGLQHQYHQSKTMNEESQDDAWGALVMQSPDDLAKLAADSALSMLLSKEDVATLFQQAIDNDWIALTA